MYDPVYMTHPIAPAFLKVMGDMSMSAVLATPSRVAGVPGEETGIAPSTLGFQCTTPLPEAED